MTFTLNNTRLRADDAAVLIKGENLTCGNYSDTAPLNVLYVKPTSTCPRIYKPCKNVETSVNNTTCTYTCACASSPCSSVAIMFNDPTNVSLCDVHFSVNH